MPGLCISLSFCYLFSFSLALSFALFSSLSSCSFSTKLISSACLPFYSSAYASSFQARVPARFESVTRDFRYYHTFSFRSTSHTQCPSALVKLILPGESFFFWMTIWRELLIAPVAIEEALAVMFCPSSRVGCLSTGVTVALESLMVGGPLTDVCSKPEHAELPSRSTYCTDYDSFS